MTFRFFVFLTSQIIKILVSLSSGYDLPCFETLARALKLKRQQVPSLFM